MGNGTNNDSLQPYQAIQQHLSWVVLLQFAPAGLLLPVPANRARSCSIMLPVVGIPLPLVSYGGTSALTLMAGFGIVMAIHTHRGW